MEAFNFATGNEDHNGYLYDMRNLQKTLKVYKGHVGRSWMLILLQQVKNW